MVQTQKQQQTKVKVPALFDRYIIFAVFCLISIGLIMVASASMVISEKVFHQPFHFLMRQIIFLGLGLLMMFFIVRVSIEIWQRFAPILFVLGLLSLVLVLVPGIGHVVNGSRRWVGLGPIALQVSEFVKLAIILYMAGYLVRRQEEVRTRVLGFIKPMALLGLIALLLLMEPDFGATVVVFCTIMSMMFMAGVRLRQFVILLTVVVVAFALLAISAPYRLERLTTFINPWANPYGSGYQLTQSLIAFGRGGWFGVGLGESVQKLFYLPEAHTDFLFAVLAEELGLFGVLIVISLFCLLIFRILLIARRAQLRGKLYAAYCAYGMAVWLGMQAVVNMGVNAGILPTKGLTLPLMSYGGSSLLIDCIAIGILLRIDHETRVDVLGLNQPRYVRHK
mgnify:CR=1 FL=1